MTRLNFCFKNLAFIYLIDPSTSGKLLCYLSSVCVVLCVELCCYWV